MGNLIFTISLRFNEPYNCLQVIVENTSKSICLISNLLHESDFSSIDKFYKACTDILENKELLIATINEEAKLMLKDICIENEIKKRVNKIKEMVESINKEGLILDFFGGDE